MLDLGFARLPHAGAYYADSSQIEVLAADLVSIVGAGEKTFVYYDGPRSEPGVCGSSHIAPAYAGRLGFTFVWLQSLCAGDIGSGGIAAVTGAHELVHSFGAVQVEGPSNRCLDASRVGHVCDDAHDLMFPYASGAGLSDTVLDVGRDDYYAHSGRWWDVQDSPWLTRLPQRSLTVTVQQRGGAGKVSGLPGTADCRARCTAVLDDGLRVRLRPAAESGSRLWSWRGACSGWHGCVVTMDDARSVTATFGPDRNRVTVAVRGRGRVVSTPVGINCTGGCGAWFVPDVAVRLRALPRPGWRFARWTGACVGGGACRFRTDADRTVSAVFVAA
jgi:hypothetical protein